MNRRDFMRRMFGTAVSIAVPQLWLPTPPGLEPSTHVLILDSLTDVQDRLMKMGALYGGARGGGKTLDLYTALAHHLGISRNEAKFRFGGFAYGMSPERIQKELKK